MPVTRTAYADKDAWVTQQVGTTTNRGNGDTTRITVGPTVSATDSSIKYKCRGLFQIPITTLLDQLVSLSAATLKLTVHDQNCASRGGTVKIWVEELLGDFGENSPSSECVMSTSGTADKRWPGPTATTANRVKYEGAPTLGTIITFNILSMLQAKLGSGETHLRFRLIAADTSTGYAEETTSRTVTLHSSETANNADKPQIEVTGETTSSGAAVSVSDTASVTDAATITTPALFSVADGVGKVNLTQQNTESVAYLNGVSVLNSVASVKFIVDKLPVAGQAVARLLSRYVDASNYYLLSLNIGADSLFSILLSKRVAGVITTLKSESDIQAFVDNQPYWMKLQTNGINPTVLNAKIWRDGLPEPDWQVTVEDSEAGLQVASSLGLGARVTAVENLPILCTFDELTAVAP